MNQTNYLNFENKFRGSSDAIKDQLTLYDPLIDIVINHNSTPTFVDVGCGRGEWLEKRKNDDAISYIICV